MSPFCGATDTLVLDFWWHLLWVSKPEWTALLEFSGGVCVMLHIPWDSPLVRHPLTPWRPAWQPSHLFHIPARHWWESKPGAIMTPLTVWDQADALTSQCEIRQTLYRLSIPARLDASVDAGTPNQSLIHLHGSFTSTDVKGEIYLLLDFLLFNRHDNKGFVTLNVYNGDSDKAFEIQLHWEKT